MIIAFVACMDDGTGIPIRGNGKTNAMTGYTILNRREGKRIITNYETDFAEIMGFQEMINTFKNPAPDTILAVTEMGRLLGSIGSETQKVLFVDAFVRQLRKLKLTLYYDDQRFKNINKRLRVHTDIVFITKKTHLDGRPCYNDLCEKEHIIEVYSEIPFKEECVRKFYAAEVGKHYNSEEFILDELIVPKRKMKVEDD